MEFLDLAGAGGCRPERLVELGHVPCLDHDVEFTHAIRSQAQLAPQQPPGFEPATGLVMVQIGGHSLGESDVLPPVFQVAPDMIDVHSLAPQAANPVAAPQLGSS